MAIYPQTPTTVKFIENLDTWVIPKLLKIMQKLQVWLDRMEDEDTFIGGFRYLFSAKPVIDIEMIQEDLKCLLDYIRKNEAQQTPNIDTNLQLILKIELMSNHELWEQITNREIITTITFFTMERVAVHSANLSRVQGAIDYLQAKVLFFKLISEAFSRNSSSTVTEEEASHPPALVGPIRCATENTVEDATVVHRVEIKRGRNEYLATAPPMDVPEEDYCTPVWAARTFIKMANPTPNTIQEIKPRFIQIDDLGQVRNMNRFPRITIDQSYSFIFIVHGFQNNSETEWMLRMLTQIKKVSTNTAVFIVDWGGGAYLQPWNYPLATANTQVVGEWLGKHIKNLKDQYGKNCKIRCIGHSLGSHVIGCAGRVASKLSGDSNMKIIDRIDALDPAGPKFEKSDDTWFNARLTASDASFVQVIHTDGYQPNILIEAVRKAVEVGAQNVEPRFDYTTPEDDDIGNIMSHYGTLVPCGHVDFYPNYGHNQPQTFSEGCQLSTPTSHSRAVDFFIWSISNPGIFATRKTWHEGHLPDFEKPGQGKFKIHKHSAEMGFFCSSNSRGIYYLEIPEKQKPWIKPGDKNTNRNVTSSDGDFTDTSPGIIRTTEDTFGVSRNLIQKSAHSDGELIYPKIKDGHGLVVVVNNYRFDNIDSYRAGAEQDTSTLCKLFGLDLKGKYEVRAKENLTTTEFRDFMDDTERCINEHRTKLHSLLIVIMSHGCKNDLFLAKEGAWLSTSEEITMRFSSVLPNRPKIFLFQICRGSNEDRGAAKEDGISSNANHMKIEAKKVRIQSSNSDILIVHSTPQGFKSYRYAGGTWFIQKFCKLVLENSSSDLKEILNRVSIASKYKDHKFLLPDGKTEIRKQIISYVDQGFTHKFYF